MNLGSHRWWSAGPTDGASGASSAGVRPAPASSAADPGPGSEQRIQVAAVLAAGLAHEVNNTLTAMFAHLSALARQLFVELQPERPAPPAAIENARRHVIGAQEAADHMAGVVGDVLAFVRAAPPVTDTVDVGKAVERALSLAQFCTRGDVVIERRLDDVASVQGSATAVTQIVLNLLLNAFDALAGAAAKTPARVRVTVRQHGALIALEVQDNGPGLSADVAERLFLPLSTGRAQGGVGLGLAITLQLVNAMRGEIEVASPPEGGTRFRVLLPAIAS